MSATQKVMWGLEETEIEEHMALGGLQEDVEVLEAQVEAAQNAHPLRDEQSSVSNMREHMHQHVEDLEHLPEWLRPELLRALLHEGGLT